MNDIKIFLKYIIKEIIRTCSRALFTIPIKKNRILFTEYWGEKMTDNPRRIYDFLVGLYPDKYEYIWVYNGDKNSVDLPDNIKIIKRFSFKWFYYMATSKVIIDNYTPSMIIPRRKGQSYIQTWHAGGAYKRVGSIKEKNKIERKTLEKAMMTASVFVSSSKAFTKGDIEEGFHYTGYVLKSGMPRNDVFFDNDAVKNLNEKVRSYYSLEGPVILYAPTFRGDLSHSDEIKNVLDITRIRDTLEQRYNQEVNILVRCHFWDKHEYEFSDTVIDVSNYPDMQELLCASDILITDYSSSMWDYALMGRPCLLYTPDLNQYSQDPGFFTPPEKWPGIICKNLDGLCDNIINLNEEDCLKKAKKHLEYMQSYENGHATEVIVNKILGCLN